MASDRESRQNLFKNVTRHEDARRRRNESSVELRKMKKDEQLMKRRNVDSTDDNLAVSPESPGFKESSLPMLSLRQCIDVFGKGDATEVLTAVQSVRRMLSRQKNPPIDSVIEAGLVNYLVAALTVGTNPEMQFEAAWAVTNIVSGNSEQTAAAVKSGAIAALIPLLSVQHDFVVEQAAWAVGNIAGDSAPMRDLVVEAGAATSLISLAINPSTQGKLQETVSWAMSNLCRHKNPLPSLGAVKKILPALAHLITVGNAGVVGDACWALSYLSDGPNDRIQMVIDAGVAGRLVELLSSDDIRLIAPALRTLGNLVTGDDRQTQVVIDSGILSSVLPALLKWPKAQVVKEACWTLSNITAGSQEQIQKVIESGCISIVVQLLANADFKVQSEALWVVANILSGGSASQIGLVVEAGLLTQLCELLTIRDSKTALLVLESLGRVLAFADKTGKLDDATLVIEECGGLDKLEKLQESDCEDVYRHAVALIEKYFDVENQEEKDDGTGVAKFAFE